MLSRGLRNGWRDLVRYVLHTHTHIMSTTLRVNKSTVQYDYFYQWFHLCVGVDPESAGCETYFKLFVRGRRKVLVWQLLAVVSG